jgi:DNA-directed RNA polymerase subunit L
MVNLNIDLPDEVHKSLKFQAIKEDKTLKNLIVSKLAVAIEGRKKDAKKKQA